MEKRKVILGLKPPSAFSLEERKMIIEEYLRTGCKKRDIWQKYTGKREEHGRLLEWMRQLGYAPPLIGVKLSGHSRQKTHHHNKSSALMEDVQLREKIAALEKALVQSELRATAMSTMIEVAEKELKVNIRKKSFTKRSTR